MIPENEQRISIPFFYEPAWDAFMEPMPLNLSGSDIQLAKSRQSYLAPISYGDHLKAKVLRNFEMY